MLYRVSYYRTAEVLDGRAPRYMKDVEAKGIEDAMSKAVGEGEVAWGAYKTPKNLPINETSRYYVFLTPRDRERWYQKLKAEKRSSRKCRTCGKAVGPRVRECEDCKAKANAKHCADCGVEITSRRRCETCADKHEKAMEKSRRDERRIREKVIEIEAKIRVAMSFHPVGNCCNCLNSYIDAEKAILEQLKAGNADFLDVHHLHMCKCQVMALSHADTGVLGHA